ncbi:MAG: YceI family protein [Nevskia sp.]|nr:YceI family protein [Nevskia sp.]
MTGRRLPRLGAAVLLLAALDGLAADAKVSAARSTLSAVFTQMNVPVEAPFKQFSGSVDFDPTRPAQARAHLDIDTASFDLGDEDYNSEVRKPAWLDTAHYPRAGFEATGLKPLGGNRYEASGTLKLKGKDQNLTATVTVGKDGAATVFDGSVPISRGHFGIGDAQWQDTVADQVTVKFHIVVPPPR